MRSHAQVAVSAVIAVALIGCPRDGKGKAPTDSSTDAVVTTADQGRTRGKATGESHELDGMYFLEQGRTLLIDGKRFVLSKASKNSPQSLIGEVTISAGAVGLASAGLPSTCFFDVSQGHLWLGVMRRSGTSTVFTGDSCTELFGGERGVTDHPQTTWDESSGEWTFITPREHVKVEKTWVEGNRIVPEFARAHLRFRDDARLHEFRRRSPDVVGTPWSVDLGEIGVRVAAGVDARGVWRGVDSGSAVTVDAEAQPEERVEDVFSGKGPDLSRVHWHPNGEGVSSQFLRVGHGGHALYDAPVLVQWVMLSESSALRSVSGGCGDRPRSFERFHREK